MPPRPPGGWSALVALGCLSLAAVGSSVLLVRRTAAGHIYDAAEVPPASVALVLGAQVYPDGTPSPFLAARLNLAKGLYDGGKVTAILVSGDAMAKEYDEPQAMRLYLIRAGVPAAQVLVDGEGVDTYRSCVRAQRLFGISGLIVVTQSYHLPRAVATARLLGMDAVGVGDDTVRGSAAWRSGTLRDQLACVKTVLDLAFRRRPITSAAASFEGKVVRPAGVAGSS
jgi:vancomycin permeability regulator SanA